MQATAVTSSMGRRVDNTNSDEEKEESLRLPMGDRDKGRDVLLAFLVAVVVVIVMVVDNGARGKEKGLFSL